MKMTTTSIFFILVTLLIGSIARGDAALTSVVTTDKGPVRGEILTTVLKKSEFAAFKGIPYATPPLGELRFKPPVEHEEWTDVLNATSDSSMCTQYNSTTDSVVGSEDCLYLNVFTPHTEFNGSLSKPVMVWIYGGAFRTGNSNMTYYGPDFLLEEDVIVVSMNYRLGALGFLNLNHENATGNAGLKDQTLALKWVQNNIANFGGNPKNVTIFGQSAGSVAVDLHVLSDMSAGLFSKSISQSGSPLCLYWGFQTAAEAEEQGFILGAALGTTELSKTTLLKTLYNASADDIVVKTNDIPLLPFRPTVESTSVATDQEKFLTECSLAKYTTGNYSKGPHMMGFTSSESVAFAGNISYLLDLANAGLNSIKTAALSIDIPFLSGIVAESVDRIEDLSEAAVYELVKDTTNLFFVTGIDSKQKLLRLHNGYPIYYYRFSYDSNYSLHRLMGVDLDGAGHEDELEYIFYLPYLNVSLNNSEIAVTRQRMVRMWTNFAKYGNPTPNGTDDSVLGITWPDSGILGKHLEINVNLTIGNRPTDTAVKFYEVEGLGTSLLLNDCQQNLLSNGIGSITDTIKSLFG